MSRYFIKKGNHRKYYVKKSKFQDVNFKAKINWQNNYGCCDCDFFRTLYEIFNFIIGKYDVIHIERTEKE